MPGEGLRVRVVRLLQFWWNSVMIEVWRGRAFGFGASANSQEQGQSRPHCSTRGSSDGGTASPSDATSSGEGKWKEIPIVLTAKQSAPRQLQIPDSIDPAGEFKVPLDEASQPTDAAATGPSVQCQISPPIRSLEDFNEHGIIIAQRTPKPAVQDVKIGNETLVINTRVVTIAKSTPYQIDQGHVCVGVNAFYQDRFREFGKPEMDNAEAGPPVEAKPYKGPGHVPPPVSEGRVSTFAIDVDKTTTNLVPSMENRRPAAGDRAEVLANLEQTSPTQKSLPLENDGNGSLGQGSSSRSFM